MKLAHDFKTFSDGAKDPEVVILFSVIFRYFGKQITEYINEILDCTFFGAFRLDFNGLCSYPELSKGLAILMRDLF